MNLVSTAAQMAIHRNDLQWLRTHIRGLNNAGLKNEAAMIRRQYQAVHGFVIVMNDNSSPKHPAEVITRERLQQTTIYTPDGGIFATFRFARDAQNLAENTWDYVKYVFIDGRSF